MAVHIDWLFQTNLLSIAVNVNRDTVVSNDEDTSNGLADMHHAMYVAMWLLAYPVWSWWVSN